MSQPSIAWPFIYAQEGGLRTHAYVPPDTAQNSGVTLAAGIDLGQVKPGDAMLSALPADLLARISPYIGKRGRSAVLLLQAKPLVLSNAEADFLMAEKKAQFVASVSEHFDAGARQTYSAVPEGPATALMSVAWQYGDPWRDPKCGDLWKIAQACDWKQLAAYLIDTPSSGRPYFPDRRFASRRAREGQFILQTLGAGMNGRA